MKQEDGWWVGWIEEIPGVSWQEKAYDELKETLEIMLSKALEFNRLNKPDYAHPARMRTLQ